MKNGFMKVTPGKHLDTTISIMKKNGEIESYYSRRGGFLEEKIVNILTKKIPFSEIKMENCSATIILPFKGQKKYGTYINIEDFFKRNKFKEYNYLYNETVEEWYYINVEQNNLTKLFCCIMENFDRLEANLQQEFNDYIKLNNI